MSLGDLDRARLQQALALAGQAIGLSDPNPRVGCVIGRADGSVLGTGFTQQVGGPHAEVMALRDARSLGHDLHGATAWVTLEPCAHHGRTPPCCDALIEAGLARVVVAIQDPFPEVCGRGLQRLRAAGLTVDLADAAVAEAARELNIGFFTRVERGTPWVRVKVAASMDGRTALPNGVSQWITGPEARADGHAWRRRAGAVLTGIGTVLADDPRLDVRLVPTRVQPLRVVIDRRLRLPPSARMLAPPGRTLIFTEPSELPRAGALVDAGAEVADLVKGSDSCQLKSVLAELARRGCNELHVEAGARLNGALHRLDAVDEWLVYLAPRLIGPGTGMAELDALQVLAASDPMQWVEASPVGKDLRLRARRAQPA